MSDFYHVAYNPTFQLGWRVCCSLPLFYLFLSYPDPRGGQEVMRSLLKTERVQNRDGRLIKYTQNKLLWEDFCDVVDCAQQIGRAHV